mmetsp:Transcript_81068/g.208688  ORF Transcript_81068/g.208688 Transcript_81068/m.208688 type:complete len:552 (-) Transcript_81068:142-1797(-)
MATAMAPTTSSSMDPRRMRGTPRPRPATSFLAPKPRPRPAPSGLVLGIGWLKISGASTELSSLLTSDDRLMEEDPSSPRTYNSVPSIISTSSRSTGPLPEDSISAAVDASSLSSSSLSELSSLRRLATCSAPASPKIRIVSIAASRTSTSSSSKTVSIASTWRAARRAPSLRIAMQASKRACTSSERKAAAAEATCFRCSCIMAFFASFLCCFFFSFSFFFFFFAFFFCSFVIFFFLRLRLLAASAALSFSFSPSLAFLFFFSFAFFLPSSAGVGAASPSVAGVSAAEPSASAVGLPAAAAAPSSLVAAASSSCAADLTFCSFSFSRPCICSTVPMLMASSTGAWNCTPFSIDSMSSTMLFASEKTSVELSTLKAFCIFTTCATPRSANSTSAKVAPFTSCPTRAPITSPKFAQSRRTADSETGPAKPAMCIVRRRWSSASSFNCLLKISSWRSGLSCCSGRSDCCAAAMSSCFCDAMGSTTVQLHATPRMAVPVSLLPSATPVDDAKSICAKNWLFAPGYARNVIFSILSWGSKISRRMPSVTCGLRFLT